MMEFLFWLCLLIIVYAIVGFPILLLAFDKIFGRDPVMTGERPKSFTFMISALNEEASIREKVENCLSLADSGNFDAQVLVVSDGSTDGTVEEVKAVKDPRIELIERKERSGKALALNSIIPLIKGEIVIFTDANSIVEPGALDAMADVFRDPDIGGVCGEISVDTSKAGAIGKGEGWYWTYDQAMKRAETRLGGAVSAQGSFYAIRHQFVGPLRVDCADDFFNSVRVVAMGSRLAFEPKVSAVEHVTEKAKKEMGRRIRSTERGWRALLHYRHLMNPATHGWYAWQLFSHKCLRRLIPFFLLLFFLLSLATMGSGGIYALAAWAQILVYGLVLIATALPRLRALPGIRHLFFFTMSNLAMGAGLVRYLTGHRSTLWTPVRE
ncbi:MAG: glycosyltransferase [Pseudomonadota bacterium]